MSNQKVLYNAYRKLPPLAQHRVEQILMTANDSNTN